VRCDHFAYESDAYLSAASRRRSSFSTASRIKPASRRLPTSASILRIVSTGSLTVVGFIPRGGRPIAACVSGSVLLSNGFIVDAIVYCVYDIVYCLNGVVYGREAPPLFSTDNNNARCRGCSDSRPGGHSAVCRGPRLHITTRPIGCPSRGALGGVIDGRGGPLRGPHRCSKRTRPASTDARRPASQSYSIPQCRKLLRAGRAGFLVASERPSLPSRHYSAAGPQLALA
jgi:hypothetical protein